MNVSKKWLFVLVAVMVVAGTTVAYAQSFSDVPPSNTHYDGIEWAVENGITVGYADGTYRPWEPVNRGQMATFLNRFYDNLVAPLGGGLAGLSGCVQCHDSTNIISGREAQWSTSGHGMGEAFIRGTSADCAGCHSGGAFQEMVAAGLSPDEVAAGDDNVSRQDCRACHQIHETGTSADWALETTAPVGLYAFQGVTFSGGDGNLCATCHQPRRSFADQVVGGEVNVDSTHWGPHHGPQSAMMLGTGGALVEGSPMFHYSGIIDTCVTCHVFGGESHTFAPQLSACEGCHTGDTFDVGGTQTEVQALLDELQTALQTAGLLDTEGEIVVGTYPEAQAGALWNWIYVAHEDSSLGVHNPDYTKAILQAGIDALAP